MNKIYKLFNLDPEKNQNQFWLLLSLIVISSILIAFLSPVKILGLIIGILLLIAAIFKPLWIIFFLAIYTPFEPFLLKFIPDEIYIFARYFGEFLIYVIVLQIVINFITGRLKLKKTPLDLPFVLFFITAVISLIINLVPIAVGVLGLRMLLRYILVFYLIVYLNPPKKFVKNLIYTMLVIVFFQAALGAAQAFIGYPLDSLLLPSQEKFYGGISLTSGTQQIWISGQRVFATLGRYDQLGTFLAFFLLIVIGFLYQKSYTQISQKKLFLILLILGIFTLVMTYSRSSWFGFLLGLFVIGYLIKKDKKVLKYYSLATFIIIAYLFFSPMIVNQLIEQPQMTPVERFFEALSKRRWLGEYYGLGRMYFIVKTPTVVVASNPLFGVGPGMYGGGTVRALHNTRAYDKLGLPFGIWGTEGHIDNNWMSIWGETGTLGLIFYIWMLVALFRMSYRVYKNSEDRFGQGLALGYCGAIIAVSLNAFLATFFEIRTLALYLWMTGGVIYTLYPPSPLKS